MFSFTICILLQIFLLPFSASVCRNTNFKGNSVKYVKKEPPAHCSGPLALLYPECAKESSTTTTVPSTTAKVTAADATPTTSKGITKTTTTTESTAQEIGPSGINYYGVAFSPYVVNGRAFDSYSVDDIRIMLNILLTYHNTISTYGVGVTSANKHKPWYQAESNCLIARSAASINIEKGKAISIIQGINQHEDPELQNREIENAFSAAEDANGMFPETVWGFIFTNDYIDKCENCGSRTLEMIKTHKKQALSMNILVGTKTKNCEQINGGPYQLILIEIAQESNFIMCDLYPPANSSNVDKAILGIRNAYDVISDGFWEVNPTLDVIIGETGWASEGPTSNPSENNSVEKEREFWQKMKKWARKNQVKVQMFEGFDEPWRTVENGEGKYGWWFYNGTKYIEKSTGKAF